MMPYQAEAMTQRMKRVKQTYLGLTVPTTKDPYHPDKYKCYRSGDRLMTLGYLRGFDKHADALTTRLRTSYAEAEELYEAKPQIYDDELLLGHLYLPEYTEEEQAEYDALCDKFSMSSHTLVMRPPRKDHICLDFDKLLRLGVNGLRDEIKVKLEEIDLNATDLYPNLEGIKRWEFYQCCLIELDAVSDLAARYSEEALRLAEEKPEPRKSELMRLGNMLKKVPNEPATDFYEALQSVQFFLSTLFGLYPLGRPDRYLYPYYEKDINSGKLTKEFAQELIDNLCLYVSDRVFTRAACGFIVGGKDEKGDLVENDLTYMFLTALDHLKLPDPNGALAVNRETSDGLLEYCAEVLSHGTTHPAFYNDDAIASSLVKHYGVEPSDAVNYIHSTCAEISVIGKSKAHTTPFLLDLPKYLVSLAQEKKFSSFDDLYDSYVAALKEGVKSRSLKYAVRILEGARIGNEAMRICALIDNCIERGKSIYEGGEKYMFEQPIFIGFATAVDSLIAIRELVYTQKKLSLEELTQIVLDDFKGKEPLRQFIINKLPHYGNDDSSADGMADRLACSLQGIFKGNVVLWDHMMPGTFSYINHATVGAKMGATFDGRRAGTSYSDGCSAVQGRDVNGPTAMLLSLTSWDQSALLGGMVVNIKFGKDNLDGRGRENFLTLVRAFMERGGIELQVNVVDRATLEDARVHPENHRDLIVRIGGYSDYFTRLSPVLQQEIIDRTEY
jgi:formate C-acetyltransferase